MKKGYVVCGVMLRPEKRIVQKSLDIQVPRSKHLVRSLLWLINFYAKLSPNFSSIVACLSDLTSKHAPGQIKLSYIHEKALNQVKHYLNSEPFLRLPDLSQEFAVFSDVSSTSLGAALCQR